MSGHRDIDETCIPKGTAHDNAAILTCIDNARTAMSAKDYGNCLQQFCKDTIGTLPGLEILDAKGDVPPPPDIKAPTTSDKDLAVDGIKREHHIDEKGRDNTDTKFPNGIEVSTWPGGDKFTGSSGIEVTSLGGMSVGGGPKGMHESHKEKGVFLDGKGQEVYKENGDGSITVFTETGAFKADKDGSVTKQLAIHTPDGKWLVIGPNNPLDGLPKFEDEGFTPSKNRGH